MPAMVSGVAFGSLGGEMQLRAAVLRAFCDPLPQECEKLWQLSAGQWVRLLRWLDTSGLALYFLDRLGDLRISHLLPADVLARLERNRRENAERTRSLIDESNAIHREFQRSRLCYATLKGFSLWPSSVPSPELRSQLDLDFLVADESAPEARRILEGRGYRLHAISGHTWEFKTTQPPGTSLRDLYKAVPHRCVELHLPGQDPGRMALLDRAVTRDFRGVRMPVLSPADLIVGQGIHLCKHVFSEFVRSAHLIEFRRHVMTRNKDRDFWEEVRFRVEEDTKAAWALGVVTLLITQTMGDFAPEALTHWTVDRLPAPARLWVELYGCRAALAQFPGSKLYLLFQKELESAGGMPKRPLRRSLLPLKLPPPVAPSSTRESSSMRIRRWRTQAHFIQFRLRFHIVEGIRYFWESIRWRKLVNALAR
jgi:hypothetical protein